jgi:hypothetical protein
MLDFYKSEVLNMAWEIVEHESVRTWRKQLSSDERQKLAVAYEALANLGPQLGRPLVDRIHGSQIHNLKELRVSGSMGAEYRVLFVFDPSRKAVLLVAGDKKGRWESWYRVQIKLAESRYQIHLRDSGKPGV